MNTEDHPPSLTAEFEDPLRAELIQKIQERLDTEVPLSSSLALWFADIENLRHFAFDATKDQLGRDLDPLDAFSSSGKTNTDILIGTCKISSHLDRDLLI